MAGVKWRGERRENEALAFIWGTYTRHEGASRACVPRGDQLLRRSATASSDRFLKFLIQCSMAMTDSANSMIRNSQTVAIWFMV